MQDFFAQNSSLLITMFWLTAIIVGLILILRKPQLSQLQKDMQEQNKKLLEQYQKEQRELQATIKVVAPADPVMGRRKGRSTLAATEYVDFDPKNIEHCRAVQMLKANPARQHPTLRFHYDPATADSAYSYIVGAVIDHHCASLVKAKRIRKPSPQKVVEFHRGTVTPVRN